ncbi:transcription factor Sox-3-like protein [Aphelenchoides avenae]|nr:transcription factor Sox-3-like protein [Aphelenchus avenae]
MPRSERVKRPLNAFEIWAQDQRRKLAHENPQIRIRLTELAKLLGIAWRQLTDTEKRPFFDEAKRLRAIHKEKHPDYKYPPPCKHKRQPTVKAGLDVLRSGQSPSDGFAFDPSSADVYAPASFEPMSTYGFPDWPPQPQHSAAAINAAWHQQQRHQQLVAARENDYATASALKESDANRSSSTNGIVNSPAQSMESAQFRAEAALSPPDVDPHQMSHQEQQQDAPQTPFQHSFDDPIAAAMRAAMMTPFGAMDD